MATEKNRNATEFFSRIVAGKNPLHYKYGATVTLYTITPDKEFPALEEDGIPIYCKRAAEDYLWLCNIKKDQESDCLVNVGIGDLILGYASSCGNSLRSTVDSVYKIVQNVSFRELLYRPKSDYLSREYSSSILNRLDFINKTLINVKEEEKV